MRGTNYFRTAQKKRNLRSHFCVVRKSQNPVSAQTEEFGMPVSGLCTMKGTADTVPHKKNQSGSGVYRQTVTIPPSQLPSKVQASQYTLTGRIMIIIQLPYLDRWDSTGQVYRSGRQADTVVCHNFPSCRPS